MTVCENFERKINSNDPATFNDSILEEILHTSCLTQKKGKTIDQKILPIMLILTIVDLWMEDT